MRGLLVKEIELMKQQKQFFILVVVMGIILNLTGSGSVSFATVYFTIITAIFVITTMSYDEFDNGFVFLMTLPITRKQYVAEKYLLGTGLTIVAWAVATVLALICKFAANRGESVSEIMIGGVATIPVALLMLAMFIPLGIYFGVEKGRYIAIVLWIIIIAVVYALVKTMGFSEETVSAWLNGLNWGIAFAVAALITVIGYLGSFWISARFMEKKEF